MNILKLSSAKIRKKWEKQHNSIYFLTKLSLDILFIGLR